MKNTLKSVAVALILIMTALSFTGCLPQEDPDASAKPVEKVQERAKNVNFGTIKNYDATKKYALKESVQTSTWILQAGNTEIVDSFIARESVMRTAPDRYWISIEIAVQNKTAATMTMSFISMTDLYYFDANQKRISCMPEVAAKGNIQYALIDGELEPNVIYLGRAVYEVSNKVKNLSFDIITGLPGAQTVTYEFPNPAFKKPDVTPVP